MENLAPPEPRAPVRLTHDQAQELVLRTVATQAESLLRTAYNNSICADDAHDAYQRSMEILLRRAQTLDPASVHKWIHVVVKREAMEVRRGRAEAVAGEDIDFDQHPSPDVSSPEDRALGLDRATRAAEALRRLKPQELRAMWLKALGHSYAEIAEATGYSPTKVNRCLAEGRKSFLERFDGIEAGAECERWQPVLSAMVDGEATAAQITEARPHLRNCPACRATLRGLHESGRPLAAVLPVGLMSAGAKLTGLLDRVVGGVSGGDAGVGAAAGGVGVGGAKLAALLAAGAAATAGGGAVVAHEVHHRVVRPPVVHERAVRESAPPRSVVRPVARPPASVRAAAAAPAHPAAAHRAQPSRHLVARRRAAAAPIEFAPRGDELPSQRSQTTTKPTAVRATAPRAATPSPAPSEADSARGEFAPQP